MIIFDSRGSKNLILVILVLLFMGLITWQWIASNPFASIDKQNIDDNLLTTVKEETSDSLLGIQNSIDLGKEEIKGLGADLAKQAKQAQLIEESKKYLEEKNKINDLQAYESLELGISFEYPSSFYLLDRSDEDEHAIYIDDQEIVYNEFGGSYIAPISIRKRIVEWEEKAIESLLEKTEAIISIDEKDARMINGFDSSYPYENPPEIIMIIMEEEDLMIHSRKFTDSELDFKKIINGIIQTFKFID